MQRTCTSLSEAEQLIQSWLHDDNEHMTHAVLGPSLPSSSTFNPISDHRHTPLHWSGIETGPLSSHSVPQLSSYNDALARQYSSTDDTLATGLLPSSGLLSSTYTEWQSLNSKPDSLVGNKPCSGIRSKYQPPLSNHLLTSRNRHKSNSNSGGDSDLLSTLNWGEGEVEESVDSIVQALMKKTVSSEGERGKRGGGRGGGGGKRGHTDPRVTMEMRHKQVRERRQARDKARQKSLRRRQREKEAWQEAERLVKEGEREEGRRRRREESLVAEQMAAIRRQVQEETERRRRRDHSVGVSYGRPHPSAVLEVSEREAVMACAGECVKGEERERRRRENRAELVKQLAEVELSERKERSKVLRHAVSVWYGMVTEQRAKLCRAAAWRAWHVLVRVWGVWRGYVREKREKREQSRLGREMQREKRMITMAVNHYRQRVLRRCVCGWLVEVGRERGRREREEEGERHRERVQAFLTAASSSVMTEQEGERQVQVRELATSPVRGAVDEGRREGHTSCKISQPNMWQAARKHVDDLLSSIVPPSTSDGAGSCRKDHTHRTSGNRRSRGVSCVLPCQPVGERGKGGGGEGGGGEDGGREARVERRCEKRKEEVERGEEGVKGRGWTVGKPVTCEPPPVWPARPQPKPVTKSIPMSGMLARTEAIAERKRRREERERERVREKEESERREEEEKREKERQEREALAARHREERKIAKQREQEKLQQQRREKEQRMRSDNHYTVSLLRARGLRPWLRFMEKMRGHRRQADQFHLHWRLRCVLGKWREVVARRLGQREQAADNLHHRVLIRRAWQGWREYVCECRYMEEACEGWARELVCRCVFRAWQRATATSRREGWERERRAKMHHIRQLKWAVLLSWQRYVPLSREEREREVRRAGLRRKVTLWLPDYQPRDFDQGDTDDIK